VLVSLLAATLFNASASTIFQCWLIRIHSWLTFPRVIEGFSITSVRVVAEVVVFARISEIRANYLAIKQVIMLKCWSLIHVLFKVTFTRWFYNSLLYVWMLYFCTLLYSILFLRQEQKLNDDFLPFGLFSSFGDFVFASSHLKYSILYGL